MIFLAHRLIKFNMKAPLKSQFYTEPVARVQKAQRYDINTSW
jgi:hypothetical protein